MLGSRGSIFKGAGIDVLVVGGPTPAWSDRAKADGDLVYSGAETMMADFLTIMPDTLDPASVEPLYLRASAILVRPGNPSVIKGVEDLFKPGHRILVVNGSGQGGLWEDVAGRLGSIESVKGFRKNIAKVARNSAEAKQAWTEDASLDAWLIWTIWQKANPSLADIVDIEPQYRIYRMPASPSRKRAKQTPMPESSRPISRRLSAGHLRKVGMAASASR